ncbi:MAG: glycoside hydrolase family 127 protein, partial [Pedobacter sp.]|nr:glycoside hydrolase family 127 protein [Pedobacter sp.]
MKLKINLLLAFIFISFAGFSQMKLDGDWKYTFSDDQKYALPSFNDAEWKTKDAAKLQWTDADVKGNGFVIWLRKSVIIPSSMKAELEKTGALMVSLGRIKQEDSAFFNGKSIGATNTSDVKRKYIINEKDILWDKENTIAIRVSHWGQGSSVEQNPIIMSAQPEQLFVMKTAQQSLDPKMLIDVNKPSLFSIGIRNNANRAVEAVLQTTIYDINQKELARSEKEINLNPGDNTFNSDFKSSSTFLKVTYRLNIKNYNYKGLWNDEFGYIDLKYVETNPIIAYKTEEKFNPAKLEQQTVLGWLGERLKANKDERLYKVEEEALLAGFINKPGVHPWIGEHIGKFLEAGCNTYRNTHDKALKIQIDRSAQQLISAQLADGYLGTYNFDSQWTSWDVWSHKYDLVGLLTYYQLTGFKPALDASIKIGDLISSKFGDQSGQLDIIKSGAHVGMAATSIIDPMTDLYRFTGDKKYLDFCYYITKSYDQKNGPKIISTLDSTGRVDKTANAKAYEMLSNIVGLTKLYRLTADKSFLKPVELAWNDIVKNRLYITGTTSSFEHFQDNNLLPAGNEDHMGEGCVTTTWVQLNYQLLCLTGDMKYLNE